MKKKKELPPSYPKVHESFIEPLSISMYDRNEPWAFNGAVGVRKFRTTIEIIDEPLDVIHARLEHLWIICDNINLWRPLENEAKKYNYTFKGERGSKKPIKS